ncbi:MAG: universal stress protein [Deltaproteobacteria bacterium]|nr:universal stress protein [Deltaproteobacteria bacterium]
MAFSGGNKRLGFLLCWAVVFADIGTSVYYVPGILFDEVGSLAPAFVLMTGIAFIFLAEKYADIATRYREGGGVVAVAGDAFGPYFGAFGGMLITVDYFLTTAISSVSGFQYFDSIVPLGNWLIPAVIIGLILLGILNGIGIKESAGVTTGIAVSALVVDLVVIMMVAVQLGAKDWERIWEALLQVKTLSLTHGMVGFAGAWLAFSGLESISQLSPAMRSPRDKTSRRAMAMVVAAILVTSPLLTAFSTVLDRVNKENSERFISELGWTFGAFPLKLAVVVTASVLLLFAANTAIIGGYHVFRALARQRFLPEVLARLSPRFGTPHVAIGLCVFVPVLVIISTRGNMTMLGHMYAFGLLGAFTLSSAGLDIVRWREKKRGLSFFVGLFTTAMVLTAWLTNIVTKPLATYFGGGVTCLGMAVAIGVRRGWFRAISVPIPYVSGRVAEQAAAELPQAAKILTLDEARELQPVYQPRSMLCLRGGPNETLLERTVERAEKEGEQQIYVLFVDEVPGLFFPAGIGPSDEANEVLSRAVAYLEQSDIIGIPVWRVGHSAGETIAHTASELDVRHVIIGTSRRTPLWKLLRGSVLRELNQHMREGTQLIVVH